MSGETGPVRVAVIRYPDRVNLVLAYTDPVTGRRRTKSAGTRRMADAERLAAKWEAQLEAGVWRPSPKVAWEGIVDRYIAEALVSLRPTTQATTVQTLDLFAQVIGPLRGSGVTTETIARFAHALRQPYGAHKRRRTEATVARHLRHLKACVRWAHQQGYLRDLPQFRMPGKGAGAQRMKGRPITTEEFERMLDATEGVVGKLAAESWRDLLWGLWTTGLRLGEALNLRWDQHADGAWVVLRGRKSVLAFDAAAHKAGRVELIPLAPEAVEYLTPRAKAKGFVFAPLGVGGAALSRNRQERGKTISEIGKAARVLVSDDGKSASAQDLRRSFGTRWSRRVMPATLMQVMRHRSIATTMVYYAHQQAEEASAQLWDAVGNNPVTSTPPSTPKPARRKPRKP